MKLRIRTAAELARMFWKPSDYGSPIVDGLALCPEEMDTIARALVEYAKLPPASTVKDPRDRPNTCRCVDCQSLYGPPLAGSNGRPE